MTSRAGTILHYAIESQIGAGGMGVVYRALDTRLDRTVALKFLPDSLAVDPDAKRRLVVEAKAAAKLDHPNIGVIHGIEETDGRLFIVMALYEGQPLDARLRNGALSAAEAVDIALQAAHGLARAHADGIVHRDIKPANLFLSHDGLLKILDFGLVKLDDGGGLTMPGAIVGTPEYMAPEQVRGQPSDRRVDVWGLGVVLYEMLTGVSPFRADGGLASIILRVASAEPRAVLELAPGLPPALQDVVERALAKDPDLRYSSAMAFAEDLEAAKRDLRSAAAGPSATASAPGHHGAGTIAASDRRGDVPVSDVSAGAPAAPASVAELQLELPSSSRGSALLEPVPRTARFVGREHERAVLRSRLERERSVAIRGMPGGGKSTLGAHLARELYPEDHICWFTFDPVEKNTADSVFWSLAAFLASRGEALLWKYLQGEIEAHRPLDRTVRLNLLLSSIGTTDCVFCFDDVHLVGDVTEITELFKALQRLFTGGRHGTKAGFMLLGRVLPAEIDHLAVTLSGFSLGEATELLEARGLQLPAALVRRLCERTHGNPTLLELAVSALDRMAGNRLATADFVESMAGRSDIRDYVMNHIYAYLAPHERSVVDALSIFPASVELELAEDVLAGEGFEGIVRSVDSLIQKSVVHEDDDGRIHCHDLVREFCYRTLDGKLKRRLHQRAAEHYEATAKPLRAAFHYFEHGDAAKALSLLTAHDRAIIAGGGVAALLDQLSRFDARTLRDEEQLGFFLARGEALVVLGEYRRAVNVFEEALDELLEDESRIVLLTRLGSAYSDLGEYDRAFVHFSESLELCRLIGDEAPTGQIHRVMGVALMRLGRLADARHAFETGLARARATGDASLEAYLTQYLGLVELQQGDLEAARKRLETSRRAFRDLGDRIGEAETIGNLAWLYGRLGQPDRELSLDLKLLDILEEVGDVGYLLVLYNNLGDLHQRSGRFAEALEQYQRLEDLARKVDHPTFLMAARIGMADNHLAQGDMARALQHARAAQADLEKSPRGEAPALDLAITYRVLGDIHVAQGEAAEARMWFAKSVPLLEEANEPDELAKALRGMERAGAMQVDPVASRGATT